MPKLERAEFDSGLIDLKFVKDDPTGTFSGYGAVFGNQDSHGDIIEKGAFTRTLREWNSKGKLPKMMLMHGGGYFGGAAEDMLPIGKWTSMEENAKGLKVEGNLFALDTDRGKLIYEGMKAGELDGMSIGYVTVKSRYGVKPTDPTRWLEDVDLKEVSVVTWGSNDRALVNAVKSEDIDSLNTISDCEAFLREVGGPAWTKKMATAFTSRFTKIARREAGDDQNTKAAQALLDSIRATSKLIFPTP